jgi:small subunit ribosomal protein S21
VSTVSVRNGNVETALRIFRRKITNSGILQEVRDRQEFNKPSAKRNRAKQGAKLRERRRQAID